MNWKSEATRSTFNHPTLVRIGDFLSLPKKTSRTILFFQIEFAVHDYEDFEKIFSDGDAFSVNVYIITSPISDGKRDLILGYDGQPIDDIERIAASFYEWCENNFNN